MVVHFLSTRWAAERSDWLAWSRNKTPMLMDHPGENCGIGGSNLPCGAAGSLSDRLSHIICMVVVMCPS